MSDQTPTDQRTSKPSWAELDAMYTRAVAVVADLRAQLDARQQTEAALEFQRARADKWVAVAEHQAVELNDLRAEHERLQAEIAEAREACPSVRRQDYFDAPLLKLIELEVSRGFLRDSQLADARAAIEQLREALRALRIDANRLCDRNLGGTYEADCRRSIAVADAALSTGARPQETT